LDYGLHFLLSTLHFSALRPSLAYKSGSHVNGQENSWRFQQGVGHWQTTNLKGRERNGYGVCQQGGGQLAHNIGRRGALCGCLSMAHLRLASDLLSRTILCDSWRSPPPPLVPHYLRSTYNPLSCPIVCGLCVQQMCEPTHIVCYILMSDANLKIALKFFRSRYGFFSDIFVQPFHTCLSHKNPMYMNAIIVHFT
jgi:hypothetical protein